MGRQVGRQVEDAHLDRAPLTGELNGVLKWNFADPEQLKFELQVKLGPFAAFTSNTS